MQSETVEAAPAVERAITLEYKHITRKGLYVKPASARGAIVLIKYGPLQTLYRFSVKTGEGQGGARNWRICKADLERVRAWARE
jgi:hypothetical protein